MTRAHNKSVRSHIGALANTKCQDVIVPFHNIMPAVFPVENMVINALNIIYNMYII